jgi:hypothetical protein
MILRIALTIGIMLVIGILAHQIKGWRRGTIIISRKQKVLRVTEAIFLIGILAMVLNGDKGLMAHHGPLMVIYYWTACFALAVILTTLAMLDIRAVSRHWDDQREINFQNLLIACDEEKKDEETPGDDR